MQIYLYVVQHVLHFSFTPGPRANHRGRNAPLGAYRGSGLRRLRPKSVTARPLNPTTLDGRRGSPSPPTAKR